MNNVQSIVFGLLLASSSAFAQTEVPVTIRVGHVLSDDSHLGRAVAVAAERIKRDSRGRLVVQHMSGGAAGNDQKAMKDAIEGNLEIFISGTSTMVPVHKPLAIWDTPYLFANHTEAYAMLDGEVGRMLLAGVAEGGLVGLAFWENGFRNMTNNVRPITRAEDFAGIRLRTMPSEVSIATFKRLGVDAKPLPFTELRAALRDGTFDGQENPYPTIVSGRIHEVQKYMTITNHVYNPFGVMASKKWWQTLSSADQKIIRDAFWDTREFQREESRKAAIAAMAEIKKSGVQISELAPGERNRISNRLNDVIARIAVNVGLPLWIKANDQLAAVRGGKK
jgi:TRAP-type transport system periplasmic protein